MEVIGFDLYWDNEFAEKYQIKRCGSAEEAMKQADVISLHVNLSDETRNLVNEQSILEMRKGVVILNCARGEIVHDLTW